MSIALDAVSSARLNSGDATSTTLTWAHTVGASGADRILVVAVQIARGSSIPSVSTVTYAGQSLTKTDGAPADMTKQNSANTKRVELWKLVNPPTGTNNIVLTISAGGSLTNRAVVGAEASSWTGVDQTTPLGTSASASGTSTTPSVDVSSAAGEVVVDSVGAGATTSTTLTVGAGQTQISTTQPLNAGVGASSYEDGAATTTMSWTASSSAAWATVGVPLKASSATTPTVSSTASVGEIYVVPMRAGPFGFSVRTSSKELENQQTYWEASGMYAKVLQGTIQGEAIVWDDLYTLPTVSPAGKLAVTNLPTGNSPNGSLIVAVQDRILQYPLPPSPEPWLTPYAKVANSSTTSTDLVPVMYFSAWDGGDSVYELRYIHVVGENFVNGVDSIAVSFRWDDTNRWERVQRAYQPDALFDIERNNRGSVLHLAVSIIDVNATEPVVPTVAGVIFWVKELAEGHGTRPDRTTPESS